MKVWMVTGAGRGFGLEIARQVLRRGDAVVATARNPQRLPELLGDNGVARLMTVSVDVTDARSVGDAVDQAMARFGRIDVLVNNAGHGMIGAVEEVSDAETRAVFDVTSSVC